MALFAPERFLGFVVDRDDEEGVTSTGVELDSGGKPFGNDEGDESTNDDCSLFQIFGSAGTLANLETLEMDFGLASLVRWSEAVTQSLPSDRTVLKNLQLPGECLPQLEPRRIDPSLLV